MEIKDKFGNRLMIGDTIVSSKGEIVVISEFNRNGWVWSEDFTKPYCSRDTTEKNYHNPDYLIKINQNKIVHKFL